MLNERIVDYMGDGMSHDMLVHVFKELYQDICREFKANEDAHAKLSMQIHKMLPEVVYFKKLTESAQVPTQGSEDAAGWDLYADLEDIERVEIAPGEVLKISTGISIALPKGTFGAIYARSGLATKKGLAPINKVGVIDADYRGPVIVALKNESNETQIIEAGERIAQLVVTPYLTVTMVEIDELNNTTRGAGGFGSTGEK